MLKFDLYVASAVSRSASTSGIYTFALLKEDPEYSLLFGSMPLCNKALSA